MSLKSEERKFFLEMDFSSMHKGELMNLFKAPEGGDRRNCKGTIVKKLGFCGRSIHIWGLGLYHKVDKASLQP
jgi:hypothetical protein